MIGNSIVTSKPDFSEFSDYSDELLSLSVPIGSQILQVIELKKNMSVLDIGPSWGYPLIEIAQCLGSSSKITTTVFCPVTQAKISSRINKLSLDNIEFVDCHLTKMPFPDDSFDLIVSNNSIKYFTDLERSFAEIGRVAKIGAQFTFALSLPDTLTQFFRIFKSTLDSMALYDTFERVNKYLNQHKITIKLMSLLCEENGFGVKSVDTTHHPLRFADGTAFLNHYYIKLFFVPKLLRLLNGEINQQEFMIELEKQLNEYSHYAGCFEITLSSAIFNCHRLV